MGRKEPPTGMVLCLLQSGIPCCSVRRLEGLVLIDKILRVSWLFCLETNVKNPGYSYNMWFIGCLLLSDAYNYFRVLYIDKIC